MESLYPLLHSCLSPFEASNGLPPVSIGQTSEVWLPLELRKYGVMIDHVQGRFPSPHPQHVGEAGAHFRPQRVHRPGRDMRVRTSSAAG